MKNLTEKTSSALAISLGLALALLMSANTAVADHHASAPSVGEAKLAKVIALPTSDVIGNKMDDLHDAADKGDSIRYLNHFAKDGVFMGTDDWERWPYAEFAEYVNSRFKDGEGWSYKPVKRFTNFSDDQTMAWVDEILESEKWGRFRGTAVLANTDMGWKLKHYSMTMLVPNETWMSVSPVTKKGYADRSVEAGQEPLVAAELPEADGQ